MGLFGIRKKKEGEFLGHLSMPEKPKIEGEITEYSELGAPSPPTPAGAPGTSQIADEKSSFEIPDFSEDDLKFDMPIEKELMTEQPEPVQETEPEKEQEEPEPEPVLDEELPLFELGGITDQSSIREEIPEREIYVQKEEKSEFIKTRIEVYVERNHYLDTLSREEEVIDGIKQIRTELNNISKYADKEEKIFKEVIIEATRLKDQIIMLDSKIFEQR